MIQETPV
ncbi:hypothetical protein YPPY13_1854, partial [Yersinia pestis PY-13]